MCEIYQVEAAVRKSVVRLNTIHRKKSHTLRFTAVSLAWGQSVRDVISPAAEMVIPYTKLKRKETLVETTNRKLKK